MLTATQMDEAAADIAGRGGVPGRAARGDRQGRLRRVLRRCQPGPLVGHPRPSGSWPPPPSIPRLPWEGMRPEWADYAGKAAVIHCSEADGTSRRRRRTDRPSGRRGRPAAPARPTTTRAPRTPSSTRTGRRLRPAGRRHRLGPHPGTLPGQAWLSRRTPGEVVARAARATDLADLDARGQRLLRLPAPGRLAGGGRRDPAGRLPRPGVLGPAGARLRRRPTPGSRILGLAPGRARRQPHRPDLHRRPLRRRALRRPAPGRAGQPADQRRRRRRPGPARHPDLRRRALRAAGQQAHPGGAGHLRALAAPRGRR